MSLQSEMAAEYFTLAAKAAERGNTREAIHYADRGQALLLRPSVADEAPGDLIGEHVNYELLGKVVSEKRRLAEERV